MDRKTGQAQRTQDAGKRRDNLAKFTAVLVLCLSLFPFAVCPINASGTEKWPGVDESVVEKFAAERGREASNPLINTDQGDLLLFAFLLAGAAGGFAAGYYWRMLIEGKSPSRSERKGKKK